jgi:hypothetical protein
MGLLTGGVTLEQVLKNQFCLFKVSQLPKCLSFPEERFEVISVLRERCIGGFNTALPVLVLQVTSGHIRVDFLCHLVQLYEELKAR